MVESLSHLVTIPWHQTLPSGRLTGNSCNSDVHGAIKLKLLKCDDGPCLNTPTQEF